MRGGQHQHHHQHRHHGGDKREGLHGDDWTVKATREARTQAGRQAGREGGRAGRQVWSCVVIPMPCRLSLAGRYTTHADGRTMTNNFFFSLLSICYHGVATFQFCFHTTGALHTRTLLKLCHNHLRADTVTSCIKSFIHHWSHLFMYFIIKHRYQTQLTVCISHVLISTD